MLLTAFGIGIVVGIFVVVAFIAINLQDQSGSCILAFASLVLLLFSLTSLGVLFVISIFDLI